MNLSLDDLHPDHFETEKEAQELDRLVRHCQQALLQGKSVNEALSPEELSALRRRYSRFEDQRDKEGFLTASAHLVTKISTPRPYIHLLNNNHPREHGMYGSFWDQSGSGFSCLDSAVAGPITSRKDSSYVPTAPEATDHRGFILREQIAQKQARIWHMVPQAGREEEAYRCFLCEQGLGTVRIVSGRNDISSDLLVFVPVDDPLEVWRLKLVNHASHSRKLKLFVSVNWGLDSYPGHYFDPRVVNQGVILEELNCLIGVNNDKKNTHPRAGFLMSKERFAGFDMTGEDFYGSGQFRIFPRAVERGRCRGSMGLQPYLGLIAAMQFDIRLGPGRDRSLDFLLGAVSPEMEKAREQIAGYSKRYFQDNGIEKELTALEESWSGMVSRHMAKTPDDEIDRFYNIWSKYQAKCSARLLLSLDMVGYRDTLQYMMGINSFNPEFVAGHLPTVLRHQYEDGTAMRQFAKFEGAPHDLRKYMDNCSWIADTLVGYVKETGDEAILEREEGFFDPVNLRIEPQNKATIYEHALRSLKGLYGHRSAENGLCLIGHGDWNDSLDGIGKDGEGVSVWLSMALVFAAQRFREMALWRKDEQNVRLMDSIIGEMTETINRNAWDGSHYIYAFMPDGTPVGSSQNEEGRIHLNVNAWSLFNGVARQAGRIEQVLEAIAGLDTPLGHLLLHPPYTKKSRYVGRIADIIPGQFENSSIYNHGQSFYIFGLTTLGKGDEAYQELKKILPEATIPDIATGPLHQLSNYTVGKCHEHFGRNLYSNFTGSVNWLRKSLDHMLGLRADFDSLLIDPVIPGQWKSYEVIKLYRGCRVHACIENPGGVNRGVAKATVDGEPLQVADKKARIPAERLKAREKATVRVVLGE